MSDKKLCFLCKSKAKATVHMLNVQVKTAKNVQISFFDAMKNLTGIDVSVLRVCVTWFGFYWLFQRDAAYGNQSV